MAKKFYIKQRFNPQLGIYYVRQGQRTKAEARKVENGSVYGSNKMLPFDTEEQYNAEIARLEAAGERVQ